MDVWEKILMVVLERNKGLLVYCSFSSKGVRKIFDPIFQLKRPLTKMATGQTMAERSYMYFKNR